MADHFPRDYFDARARFREAAAGAGARLDAYGIKATGPAGEPLSIDVARLGAEKPRRLLALLSGTHGVEGPAGTAAQLQFLTEDWPAVRLPADAAVLLVHANNPFGYAWGRRWTEGNVDLNRNFLDWRQPPPARPDYDTLAPLLNPTVRDANFEAAFMEAAMKLVAERGEPWVQARLTEGQYAHPEGLYFGGEGPVEANGILRQVFLEALAEAEEALLIDVHTGLGAYADHLLISGHAAGGPVDDWLRRSFAADRIVAPDGGDTRAPAVSGKMTFALAAQSPHCETRTFSLEFGTFEGARMLMAERAENWLFHHGSRQSEDGRAILAEVWECSTPADGAWRRRVLNGARSVMVDGWRALFGAEGF